MHDPIERLRHNILSVFIGQREVVDRVICSLLARGHVLIEDVPGVGKTVLANAIARSIDCRFTRIQLTPDLMPSDVLGVSIYDSASGEFVLKRGPIFTNILLADEINRTTPRTQTALLEAMSESQVSIDGRVLALDRPFMVLATQNPFDFEGTFLLPENQLDRFHMRLSVGYPQADDEVRILETRPAEQALNAIEPVMHADDLLELQREVDSVRVDRSLMEYVVRFAQATRSHDRIRVGLSPRGSLALVQAARATARYHNRDYAVPEDVIENIEPICGHRIIGIESHEPEQRSRVAELLEAIRDSIASPA